jgi:hypothetical protein
MYDIASDMSSTFVLYPTAQKKDCWLKVLERCSCHLGSLLTSWWKSVHRYDWFNNWCNCLFQNNSKLEVLLCAGLFVFFVTKNGDKGSTSESNRIRFIEDDLIWYWRHQKQFYLESGGWCLSPCLAFVVRIGVGTVAIVADPSFTNLVQFVCNLQDSHTRWW